MGMPTGQGKTWTAHRVGSMRKVHGMHAYRSAEKNGEWLTMTEAATKLGVTHHAIRRLIRSGALPAEQVVPGAPYQIRADDLTLEPVGARDRPNRPSVSRRRRQTRFQCLQILDEGMHNNSSFASGRIGRGGSRRHALGC